VVDLPDPLGPIRVTISPADTLMETPRTNQRSDLDIPAFSSDTSISGSFNKDIFSTYHDYAGLNDYFNGLAFYNVML
jgi:hypothetical protein